MLPYNKGNQQGTPKNGASRWEQTLANHKRIDFFTTFCNSNSIPAIYLWRDVTNIIILPLHYNSFKSEWSLHLPFAHTPLKADCDS
jgi:hypothetical protein